MLRRDPGLVVAEKVLQCVSECATKRIADATIFLFCGVETHWLCFLIGVRLAAAERCTAEA
jgi:hypothetical protein